ncbi:hypothetical protein KW543_06035 [Vibrio fluvialis]|nr:hypothetical protein [Vibrio fluvialis]
MRAFFEVHLRLVITVWVILLSVLSLLYLMNYMKFDSLMSHVVSSKLEVISSSLANSVERVERLGIPYQSAKNLKQQIEQARVREPNVVAVALIDQHGKPLVQSYADDSPVQSLPEDVVRRALKSSEPRWTLSDDSELYSGLQIYDSFGAFAGSIVIVYNKSALFGVYALVRLHLLEATVVIFLLASLLVFFIIRIGFGDVTNVIKLIHGYSTGDQKRLKQIPQGQMTQSLAEQIKQSEKMKSLVSEELEKLQDLTASQPSTQNTEVRS